VHVDGRQLSLGILDMLSDTRILAKVRSALASQALGVTSDDRTG
jgi:hypothetical protein